MTKNRIKFNQKIFVVIGIIGISVFLVFLFSINNFFGITYHGGIYVETGTIVPTNNSFDPWGLELSSSILQPFRQRTLRIRDVQDH